MEKVNEEAISLKREEKFLQTQDAGDDRVRCQPTCIEENLETHVAQMLGGSTCDLLSVWVSAQLRLDRRKEGRISCLSSRAEILSSCCSVASEFQAFCSCNSRLASVVLVSDLCLSAWHHPPPWGWGLGLGLSPITGIPKSQVSCGRATLQTQ